MTESLDEQLRRLRREFDDRFARPADESQVELEHLLAISHRGTPFAVALRGAGALLKTPAITPVPSPHGAMLGLAGVGGAVVVLYDLGALLGLGQSEGDAAPWTLLCSPNARKGVVFDAVDGYHRVSPDSLEEVHEADARGQVVRVDGQLRRLLGPERLLRAIGDLGGVPSRDDEEK